MRSILGEKTMIKELVVKNRSYRRFDMNVSISGEILRDLVDLARLSATGGNKQALKFLLSNTPEMNRKIFPQLSWAAYLKDWPGPAEDERPAAYIVILGDTGISNTFGCDHGIAAQSILLGSVEKGFGGCMIASINRPALKKELGIADHLEILLVIALGKPAEIVILESVAPGGDIKYWRDEQGRHHVPKRSLQDIIIS